MPKQIDPKSLHKILKDKSKTDYILIDVRSESEHNNLKISEAKNIPLEKLEDFKKEIAQYKTVYIHCNSGNKSQKACQALSELKNTEVIDIQGGILEWQQLKLPTIGNKNKLPIIRQVMISAGSLVLLGVILSHVSSPNWIYLSGFVGAGLVFAGVTGFCGMATLLAKMPWNK